MANEKLENELNDKALCNELKTISELVEKPSAQSLASPWSVTPDHCKAILEALYRRDFCLRVSLVNIHKRPDAVISELRNKYGVIIKTSKFVVKVPAGTHYGKTIDEAKALAHSDYVVNPDILDEAGNERPGEYEYAFTTAYSIPPDVREVAATEPGRKRGYALQQIALRQVKRRAKAARDLAVSRGDTPSEEDRYDAALKVPRAQDGVAEFEIPLNFYGRAYPMLSGDYDENTAAANDDFYVVPAQA